MVPIVASYLDKMQSIFASSDSTQSKQTLIAKGMPEALLPECSFYLDKDGDKIPLLTKDRQRFE